MSKAGTHNRHFGRKYSRFGEDGKGQEVTAYSNTAGAYSKWDPDTKTLTVVGGTVVANVTGNITGAQSGGNVNPSISAVSATGGYAAGKLVFISGYKSSLAKYEVKLANSVQTAPLAANLIISSGSTAAAKAVTAVGEHTLSGVSTTAAGAVGSAVYLSSTAAGGYTFTAPAKKGAIVQQVGVVITKAASGAITFFPHYSKPVTIAATT